MSVFNRDMSIEVLRNGLGILKIPEGITELSVDFALLFDWIPEKKCQCSFREIQLPSSIQKINGVYLTEYGPDETPIKRFKRISVSKDNPYYTDVDGVLFSKDMTRLICYPCGKTGHTYIVPDSVEVIGEFAFGNNINLKKIVLPNSLKRIEYQAFFQCENLSVINLPYGLEYIGEECFALSTSLNRLIVPLTVKHIPTSLFYEGSIVSVPNPEIELVYDLVPTEYLNMPFNGPAILSSQNDELVDFAESYDYNHFENCYEDKDGIIWTNHGKTLVCFPVEWASEEYELPDEVREVYINAFRGCSLKRFYSRHKILIVGRTVSTPRYYEPMSGRKFHITAFELFCDDDKDTNIQNDIQNNDAPPYSIDCQSTPFADTLEEEEAKNLCVDENGHIDIPEHIRIIGNHAFNCRKDIVSVTLPDGLITIKDSAFNACHNLEKINIPQSVLLIEDDAFARCFKLDHISLPDGIECIHSGTFQHCSSLRHITVSAALKSIDRIAFLYCYKLKEIILPDTVKYIYEDAFDGCNDLSIISPVGSFARKFADMHGFNKDCAVISQNISDNIKDSNTMGYAFISYSTKNQQMADSFKTLFNQNNIKTWMAPGDIPFGSTYTSTINSAIRGASCFVLLLSESAQGSQWVLRETERAVSTGKTIFTVLLDDVPMNDDFEFMLSASQAVAIRKIDTNDENIQRLLRTVSVYTNGIKDKMPSQRLDSENTLSESQADRSDDINLENYFQDNAVMKGTVLQHFRGRLAAHVVIPEGVTVVGSRAFAYYPDLLGISIPSSVTKIEEYAFINCPNLRSITVSKENPVFYSDGNCCIERATNRLVFGCCTSTIPDGVAVIGENAFNGCKNLEFIRLPDSVAHIEKSAFSECTSLKSITLPDGVVDIGDFAFCNCSNLADLMIPASVISFSNTAFYKCQGLESICVAPGNSIYYSECNCCIEIKTRRLVLGCQNSTIPDSIVNIGADAFGGCTRLREITIPDSVKEIGYEAFCGCNNLISAIISDGVERICKKSFMDCSSMKELHIPASVSEVEDFAFSSCSSMKSITVAADNKVYRSEDNCFIRRKDNVLVLGCMKSIIPDGVTEIGDDAFYGCSALTDVYLPESVTKIGDSAFDGSGLANVTISESVNYIGAYAFHQCNDLTSVVIPNNVKYIGELAFSGFDYASEKRDIFCEASKKPGRWHREWTDDDSNIYWKGEWDYDENGNPFVQ